MPKPSRTDRPSTPINDGSNIVVTTQQSRFHADANDAPESKEVDIKDLTLSISKLEILSHAHLRLREGVHYVFGGRNGTGKSTLLKALAECRIPGIPSNLRILLLGQIRIDSDDGIERGHEDIATGSQTVLQHVITSDARRERALREEALLSETLEHGPDHTGTARVVKQLQYEQAERDLAEAQLIAARRSGARGSKARQALIAREKALEEAKILLEETVSETKDVPSDILQAAVTMLETIRERLSAMSASSTEATARTILLGLGLQTEQFDAPYTSLSGGWRTRASLAAALTQPTDILLLDEPTNFLDLPAVIWLQHFINTSLRTTTVVVTTHDRAFADAVAEELLLLRLVPARSLETFKGTLSAYTAEKTRQIRRLTKMSDAMDRKKAHMSDTIQKQAQAARKTGDDKKAKQAASRKKKLEEHTGLEVSATGGRFKLNRDRVGWSNSVRSDIEIPELDPLVTLALPPQPADLRFPGPLASFENVAYKYLGTKAEVLTDVGLVIHPGERVGVAGLNGSGKSTIIQLLMAASRGAKPSPSKGTITLHSKARVQCYSQHAVEDLEALGIKEPSRTALSHLLDIAGGDLDEQEARATLGKLGLKGNFASDVPLKALSGGQRVRLALAEAMWSSPHLLVLDEVTTHLDADTINALIDALRDWQGALLVVTHDRFFMKCVVEGESTKEEENSDESEEDDVSETRPPGRVYRMHKGVLKPLPRGMQQYEDLIEKQLIKAGVIKLE
jgi:ATP-binding cassette, subfamily F, member 3